MKTLDQIQPKEYATIKAYQKRSALYVRLRELGLTCGTRVRVERFAPLGDPIEISVRGSKLSIRKKDAQSILVQD